MAFKHHVPIADGFSINIIYPSGNYVKKGSGRIYILPYNASLDKQVNL